MKSVGEFRLKESPVLTTHGFRRLNGKSLVSGTPVRGISPISQQASPLNNAAKSLDTWQRIEDASGVTYYWNPQSSNVSPFTSSDMSSRALSSSSRNACFSNGSVAGAHPKVAPTGYAPNRFPLSTSYNSDLSSEGCSSRLSSCYSLSSASTSGCVSNGTVEATSAGGGADAAPGFVYSNTTAGSAYANLASSADNSSLAYFGNSASTRSVNYVSGYENVPKNSYSSHTFQNRSPSQKQTAHQRLSPRKEGDIIGSNNNVVGYFAPSSIGSNEKNLATMCNEFVGFQRDMQPVWTICGKQQVSGEGKQVLAVRNGSPRSSVSRRKPRMPKLLHSLCCCVRPESTSNREKRRSLQGSAVASASSLITQVKKGSVNGNSGVNGNAGANDSYTVDDSDTAESMPMVSRIFR
ncbi:unnamed protein product [Toxocara canis]|uniref:WW domain-containing protein n=1 Tax=Toxocara canis TaxID=6265 RepID=A0A183TWM0_TOXCA|nr:unnamed protein product [Toxocara canis]